MWTCLSGGVPAVGLLRGGAHAAAEGLEPPLHDRPLLLLPLVRRLCAAPQALPAEGLAWLSGPQLQ